MDGAGQRSGSAERQVVMFWGRPPVSEIGYTRKRRTEFLRFWGRSVVVVLFPSFPLSRKEQNIVTEVVCTLSVTENRRNTVVSYTWPVSLSI